MSLFVMGLEMGVALSALGMVAAGGDALVPDARAVAAISAFLDLCTSTPDLAQAGRKVVAANLVHASLRDPSDPSQLSTDKMRFSFKKAHNNARLYQPVVARIAVASATGVGFGDTAEKGVLYKYFVTKQVGFTGMPAPIQVFFPEGGASPLLYDFGSL